MLHDRAPEEYPPNLGLTRPDIIRADFDEETVIRQALTCFHQVGQVELIAFWGVGWKQAPTNIDRLAMSHLGLITANLQKSLLKGVKLTLLIGDTHAWANEVPNDASERYLPAIEVLAKEFSFHATRVSHFFESTPQSVQHPLPSPEELSTYEVMRHAFERSARRLNSANAERRALHYFVVRFREREVIASTFPLAIVANSDSRQRGILTPPLPHFYIYALPSKRWRRHKPWFLNY